MVALVVFIAGLLGNAANNVSGEVASSQGEAAIATIIDTLPGDIADIIFAVLPTLPDLMRGLWTALPGLFSYP